MARKSVTVVIEAPVRTVFRYLDRKYDTQLFQHAALEAYGRKLSARKLDAVEDQSLRYEADGCDTLTGWRVGSWTWGYEMSPLTQVSTKVTIWYEYGPWLVFASAGTAGHQAATEITETVSALEALTLSVEGG